MFSFLDWLREIRNKLYKRSDLESNYHTSKFFFDGQQLALNMQGLAQYTQDSFYFNVRLSPLLSYNYQGKTHEYMEVFNGYGKLTLKVKSRNFSLVESKSTMLGQNGRGRRIVVPHIEKGSQVGYWRSSQRLAQR